MNDGLTPKQLQAMKKLEKAVEYCHSQGIALYGLQYNLVGYNAKALDVAENEGRVGHTHAYGDNFPYYSINDGLADSGADCYYRYFEENE